MVNKKIVIDTNVLISAIGWRGSSHEIFQKVVDGELEMITSSQQIDELKRVLDYPRLKLAEEEKSGFLEIINSIAIIVDVKNNIDIIKNDPEDNIILEAAVEGGAKFLISGDPHLLEIKEFSGIKILKPRDFLEAMDK